MFSFFCPMNKVIIYIKTLIFLTWIVNDNYLILINFLEYRLHFSQSWCLSKGSTIRILQGHVSVVTKHGTKLLFYVFSLWMHQKFFLSNLSLNLLNFVNSNNKDNFVVQSCQKKTSCQNEWDWASPKTLAWQWVQECILKRLWTMNNLLLHNLS